MPRTALTKTTGPGPYSHAGAAVTMTAADTVNKNQFVADGRNLVIAYNSGASPYTVTVTSAPDPYGRTKDITTESLAAGEIRIFNFLNQIGWTQTDGNVYLEASNLAVKFGVITLP